MNQHSAPPSLPRISVSGPPFVRGKQYGQQAKERVRGSIEAYARVFAHYTSWDWPQVLRHAQTFKAAIADFCPAALEEMRGVANGAGVDFGDVLAINLRSEVMFASGSQANEGLSKVVASECSAFAVLPEATVEGHTIVGQNWDWLLHAIGTVVLLEVRRDDGPDFVTLVEAGLLAKTGCNSAGFALCTNTLVSFLDTGETGIPYHVILRRLLDCELISDGVAVVLNADKALSANYLLGHVDGLAIDLETVPGTTTSVRPLMPADGLLTHTNHFLSPDLARSDSRISVTPHTLFRLECLKSELRRAAPAVTLSSLESALSDHRNYPSSVCCHPDDRLPDQEQGATIGTVIFDLSARELYVSIGNPCAGRFERVAFEPRSGSEQLDRPSRNGAAASPNLVVERK